MHFSSSSICYHVFVYQDALKKEMEVHRESQQKQIAKLRDEIQENESLIAELKEYVFTNVTGT